MKNFKKISLPRISFGGQWKDKIKEKVGAIKEKAFAKKQGGDEMQRLSVKFKLRLSKAQLRTAALVGGLAVLATGAIAYHQIRVFHGYRILSSVERSDDSATTYVRMKGRTLKCNPNGVTCVNDSDEVMWNVTFTMQSPIVDVCGSTVAVGDMRGKDVYVFNKSGEVGHFSVEHTLTKIRVAAQGVVAAVLEDGELTWTNVYDSKGTLLVQNQTSMSETGYPLDLDISADGQCLAVAYLGMDNNNIKTKVDFYNFSAVGQNKVDYLVNSAEYHGVVVPEIRFLNKGYAVVCRDDGLAFFSGKNVPQQKTEILIQEEIISLFHNDDYVGVVTQETDPEIGHKYKMQTYRCNGSKVGTCYFDMDYTDIGMYGDEILMHNGKEIEIYNVRGKKKASLEYEKTIVDILKASGSQKYEVITPDSTDRIRIK